MLSNRSRIARAWRFLATLTLSLAVLPATPADAASAYHPDIAIGKGATVVGDDIGPNPKPAGQVMHGHIRPGQRVTYDLLYGNDSALTDNFFIEGCSGHGPFTITYREGGSDTTGYMTQPGGTILSVSGTSVRPVALRIRVASNADLSERWICTFPQQSMADPLLTDTAKLILRVR